MLTFAFNALSLPCLHTHACPTSYIFNVFKSNPSHSWVVTHATNDVIILYNYIVSLAITFYIDEMIMHLKMLIYWLCITIITP